MNFGNGPSLELPTQKRVPHASLSPRVIILRVPRSRVLKRDEAGREAESAYPAALSDKPARIRISRERCTARELDREKAIRGGGPVREHKLLATGKYETA